jgi:NAD/NADP transhydrogenase beta subunit
MYVCIRQVNSDAEDNKGSSLYGMPVLKVWNSKKVVALKRNMLSSGYAGIANPMFYKQNTDMLLGGHRAFIHTYIHSPH